MCVCVCVCPGGKARMNSRDPRELAISKFRLFSLSRAFRRNGARRRDHAYSRVRSINTKGVGTHRSHACTYVVLRIRYGRAVQVIAHNTVRL